MKLALVCLLALTSGTVHADQRPIPQISKLVEDARARPNSVQLQALQDGVVTKDEYYVAVAALALCVTERGAGIDGPVIDETEVMLHYEVNHPERVTEIHDDCRKAHIDLLEPAYFRAHRDQIQKTEHKVFGAVLACMAELGVTDARTTPPEQIGKLHKTHGDQFSTCYRQVVGNPSDRPRVDMSPYQLQAKALVEQARAAMPRRAPTPSVTKRTFGPPTQATAPVTVKAGGVPAVTNTDDPGRALMFLGFGILGALAVLLGIHRFRSPATTTAR